MKKLITVLFLSLGLLACKSKKNAQSTKVDYKATDVIASIEKTPCFGFCPVYKLDIYGDGKVVYKGTKNVDNVGDYTGKATQEQLDQLFNQAKELGFAEFEKEYDGPVTDLPTTYVAVWTNGELKKIKARYNVPDQLAQFIKYFDALSKEIELTKVK